MSDIIKAEQVDTKDLSKEQAIQLLEQEKKVTEHQSNAIDQLNKELREMSKTYDDNMNQIRTHVGNLVNRLESKISGAALVSEGLAIILKADFQKDSNTEEGE